ncbi:polysaccharide deacetylase family protein [Cohnella hongkongensis]|uniref:Polysaccharide deacetylase family protein n=1 Tax=Cohnella hongkongensis TaxID=178337 RepID=A0ABV9FAT3_9BACL
MWGKRLTFGRACLSALCIVMLSAALTGCTLLREWQIAGMTGVGPDEASANAPDAEPAEETDAESAEEKAALAGARPSGALPEAETAVHPSDALPETETAVHPSDALPETETAVHPSKPDRGPASPTAKPADEAERRPRVALTFDDGPDNNYTVEILDILKKYDVKATFFLVGTQVKKFPETAKRIVDEGHAVGNHSWSHGDLTKLSSKARAEQLDRAQRIIEEATGASPRLARAPYGALSKEALATIHESRMKHVAWTVDTKDWAGTSVEDMYENVMSHTRDGGIILMHSFGGRKNALEHTVKLLPKIIEDLRAEGYDLVTVEEMIDSGEYNASAIK